MSTNVSRDLDTFLMRGKNGISEQSKQIIHDFIHALTSHEDLNPKTLKEYASDLKHFIGWFGQPITKKKKSYFSNIINTTMIYVKATRSDLQAEVEKIAWR
ncbi:hypothetical protein B7C51_16195 [Paenibacillus larvae subsp. pulvifaciens]|uniref:Core-binding (CB) domain-containing protein n=1 Tax=Paenibacillus larvae subsp. pulvifaciens TaxID=1477 RepID=A0A1V0UV14_9BACL|nr:hypothetical protein [Paenibacillus larvae]ARF69014.1 hypothetical protein B7C51_16195 [Paenibacillus larvae subsp. pulvifaciens]